MKSGCAATMIALKAFVENHKDFKGKIIATYVSVEEGPYGMGTNALIEEGYIKDVGFLDWKTEFHSKKAHAHCSAIR